MCKVQMDGVSDQANEHHYPCLVLNVGLRSLRLTKWATGIPAKQIWSSKVDPTDEERLGSGYSYRW